ncbi:uncharacterized protein FTJAE_11364 [Fusarium tjaetaba]|uniref:DUF6603 domain-containing protein n=1 Tax=Fusarium tjaetaba TaxID=1567544 RepID=A0A8H5VGK4_9HYPO|nr:uncharacterized protein FTJAE_11364 [Fusarium tjaetaba]KAF5621335.1 hypothetical protein FTJAE_11364 [Fusarium tjaetaba]
MANYAVDSYFIDVQNGDSALHVLRHINGNQFTSQAAVLVDGGRAIYADSVLKWIQFARAQYHNSLLITSIVITHWDDDHYGGIMELLLRESLQLYCADNVVMYMPSLGCEEKLTSLGFKLGFDLHGNQVLYRVEGQTSIEICYVKLGTQCLGFDLFSGSLQTAPATTKSLADVYNSHTCILDTNSTPILLCFAVDGLILGNDALGQQGQPQPNPANRNDSSIALIAIWPLVNNEPRISLYSAGDSSKKQETDLFTWLHLGVYGYPPIDVAKLSHHGASTSTPVGIGAFKVQYMYISAGRAYGHPTASTLALVMAYASYLNSQGLLGPRILASSDPYWLRWNVPRLNLLKLLSFSPGSQELRRDVFTISGDDLFAEWFGNEDFLTNVKDFWCLNNGLTEGNVNYLENEYLETYGRNTLMVDCPFPHSVPALEAKWNVMSKEGVAKRLLQEVMAFVVNQLRNIWDEVGWGRSGGCLCIEATEQGVFPEEEIRRGNITMAIIPFDDAPAGGGMEIESDDQPEVGFMEFTNFLAAMPPTPTLSKAEKWLYSFLGADLAIQKASDGSLNAVALSSTQGQLCSWLQTSFGFTVTANFTGQFDATTSKVISLDLLAIKASIAPSSSGSDAFALFINTGTEAYQAQFNGLATLPSTGSGFYKNLGTGGGFVFAVDETLTTGTTDLNAFLSLFGFSSNAFVGAFLNQEQLTLRTSTSDRPSRSGIWMIPDSRIKMYFRLEMILASHSTIQSTLNSLLPKAGFSVTDVVLWGSTNNQTPRMSILPGKTMTSKQSVVGIDSTIQTTINGTETPFPSSIVFSKASVELQVRTTGFDIDTIFTWIESIIDTPDTSTSKTAAPSSSDISSTVQGILQEFCHDFKIVAVRFVVKSASGKGLSLAKCCVDFQVSLNIKAPATSGTVETPKKLSTPATPVTETVTASPSVTVTPPSTIPILFELEWSPGSYLLSGALPLSSPNSLPFQLDPTAEWVDQPSLNALPPTNSTISISSLLDILPSSYPAGVPDVITEAEITLQKSTTSTNLTLAGSVVCIEAQPGTNTTDVPALSFNILDIVLEIGSASKSLALSGGVSLQGPGDEFDENNWSSLGVDLAYSSGDGTWSVSASAYNVSLANLYSLFAADSRSAIADVFSGINILDTTLTYIYEKAQPSQLTMLAEFLLGPVLLSLKYQHSNGSVWTFAAGISKYNPTATTETSTLGELLSDLLGENEALPDFISNLTIPLSDISINLLCESIDGSKEMGKAVLFSLDLKIGNMDVKFAQIRPLHAADATPGSEPSNTSDPKGKSNEDTSDSGSQPSKTTKAPPAKILRFSLPQIPDVSDVPVVGTLAPPVDEVAVLWTNRDITMYEATALAQNAFSSDLPLLFNQFSPEDSNIKPGDVIALAKGCHLQLAATIQGKQSLLLDHVVGEAQTKSPKITPSSPTSSKAPSRSISPAPSLKKGNPSNSTSPSSTVAPMSKQAGPLSISSVALQMSSDFTSISLVFTATLRIGPLDFTLIDLGLSLDLTSIKSFSNFSQLRFTPTLSGLALAIEKSPSLEIEGLFAKEVDKNSTRYVGGLKASFETWGALAVGMYEENKTFDDMFAFVHIQGLIAELGWAEINGLSAGLGYNTQLVPPDAGDIQQWPFIALNHADLTPQSDLATELKSLMQPSSGTAYILPQQGSYWLAVGLTVLAFKVLDIDAVLSVEMTDSDDCIINITAEATTYFPSTGGEENAFILIDVGATMTFDSAQGYLIAQAELTPLSYVLSKDCHLTGGMVYATWVSPSQYEGDFVVSIGGFNPTYKPPSYYPAAPPRLGISWAYDSDLSILGQAYFAVTPACLMGGACLDARFDCGWLKASFTAWADFFVQLHPFWFDVHVGFNFSVEVHLGWSILAINLGPLSFGADLHLWGPSVSGTATLHFWSMSHTISFGSTSSGAAPAKLDIDSFLELVRNQSSSSSDGGSDDYLFSINAGTVSTSSPISSTAITTTTTNESTSSKVQVRGAQLNIIIKTRVPILSATFNAPKSKSCSTNGTDVADDSGSTLVDLYAAPMQLTTSFELSHLAVQLTGNAAGSENVKLLSVPITTKVPPTLWGVCKFPDCYS